MNKNNPTHTPVNAHTPGPWHITDDNYGRYRDIYVMAKGRSIVRMEPWDTMDADARLIAAAPETAAERDRLKEVNAELLAALKEAHQIARGEHPNADPMLRLFELTRAAIAKAEKD